MSYTDEQLATLMRRTQQGDSVAYATLLEVLYADLKRILASQFPSYAEDLAQDVLLTLHKVRHTWQPEKPFRPWFNALVQHRISDQKRSYARHEKRKKLVAEELHLDRQAASGTLRTAVALEEALLQLPEKQRAIVSQLKLEGYSIEEIAAKFSVSPASIKVAAHRAYEKLRRFLTERRDEV